MPPSEVISREGAKVAKVASATDAALRAEDNEPIKPVEEVSGTSLNAEVSGETPATTPGTGVLPEDKE